MPALEPPGSVVPSPLATIAPSYLTEVLALAAMLFAMECRLLAPIYIPPIEARAPTLMQRLSAESVALLTGTCETSIGRAASHLLPREMRVPHVGTVTVLDAHSLAQLRCELARSESTISATARVTAIWLVGDE